MYCQDDIAIKRPRCDLSKEMGAIPHMYEIASCHVATCAWEDLDVTALLKQGKQVGINE